MFKAARWRSEKNKIKVVFKLEFHATKVFKLGWESAMVSLIPVDVGKPTARSEKVTVMEGNCEWRKPVYETVKFIQDPKTGKISDKLYCFIVSTGSAKAEVIGDATINFSEYAEVSKPSTVSLPLKTSNSGPILHVTILTVQANAQRRVAGEIGDACLMEEEMKTAGQLENHHLVGASNVLPFSMSSTESPLRFQSSSPMHMFASSDKDFGKSRTMDAPARPSANESTGYYLSKENHEKDYHNHNNYSSFPSPLSITSTPQNEANKSVHHEKDYHNHNNHCSFPSPLSIPSTPQNEANRSVNLLTDYRDDRRSVTYLSITSGPEESNDGSTNSSAETCIGERFQESDEISKLEVQTIRRQLVKETKRAQDLARDLSRVKEERDACRRECEEYKVSQKKLGDRSVSSLPHFDGEAPWPTLEEIKQELMHEKNLNANLRLQLEKTQESNSELILAVEDLEKLLEQKNREATCLKCSSLPIRVVNSDDMSERNFRSSDLHIYDCKQELLETTSEEDSEQYALEELVRGHGHMRGAYSHDQQVMDLNSEIELYKKELEALEIHLEQIALDYEILKQENHEITTKLEQSHLQEQLRVQYECSANSNTISDLETCIKKLQNELKQQTEIFEAELHKLTQEKVQQEQRATQAEEALRKARWKNASAAEQLQNEFEKLSSQMSSAFQMNEKLAMQASSEANELRLQKSQLDELVEEMKKELASVQGQCQAKVQGLSSLLTFKTKEMDKLQLELKQKSMELQNLNNHKQAREKAISDKVIRMKAELEKKSEENILISEELEKKRKQVTELEELKVSTEKVKALLQDRSMETDAIKKELDLERLARGKLVKELNDLQHLKEEKEKATRTMESELASLRAQCNDLAKGNLVKELIDLRHLKEENEMVTRTLKSELASLRAQYNDAKNSLFEDEVEKENLRKQVFHLRSNLKEKEDAIISFEKKLKDNNARFTSSRETTKTSIRNKNPIHMAPQTSKEVANWREKIKTLEVKIKMKDTTMVDLKNSFLIKEKDMLSRIEELQREISEYRAYPCGGAAQEEVNIADRTLNKETTDEENFLQPTLREKEHTQNANHSSDESTTRPEDLTSTKCQESQAEALLLNQMKDLKDKNEAMEAELKEMQERYSEISLKFAEVEGERQRLVMTVRALRNSTKS